MSKNKPIKPGMVFNSLYLICVINFVIGIAYNHVKLISHELPLDYNEPGMLVITSTIADGSNPFALENQPSRISVYPVLYNILIAPLSRFLGNTLEFHRAISGLFVLACCALCFYLCRRESGTRIESFTAAAFLYAALLYYSTPIASPNSLGLFLFLSAITIPWVHGFSTRSLAVTILLGILAGLTKQYFIACLGYVALYLFLAESKKQGIYFGMAALATLIAVLALVSFTSPYYLENTLFVASGFKHFASNEKVIIQFKEFFEIYLPLLIVLGAAIIYKYSSHTFVGKHHEDHSKSTKLANFFDFDKPLLLRKPNYVWVCCTCSVIIIVLVLGKNPGNHLTYLFQLISPFFLVGIFALISNMPKWRWPFRILIMLALYNSYFMLPADFSVETEGWQAIRAEISEADDIYASTLVLPEIIKKDGPVYLNGHTRFFVFGGNTPPFLTKTNKEETVPALWERHVKLIQTKIENQEFDLLLIDNWLSLPSSMLDSAIDTNTILKAHYYKADSVALPLVNRPGGGRFRMHIWKPISATPDTDNRQPR